ncbi:MAG TPA: error-prone DNA polymerase [Rhodanobacteraceae bacterium]|nr:error-prone DNA polymerase [Rhodanobacteraceae bacterium]
MKPPKPKKPRKLRAPLEPGLANESDDPRSVLEREHRRHHARFGKPTRLDQPRTTNRAQDVVLATSPRDIFFAASDLDPAYAELHCLSNFSFQRGASHAAELFEHAKTLGYDALAITDECSLAGIVRALEASRETGLKLIVGTEIRLADGPKLVLLAMNQPGYSDICRLITTGRRRSAKGEYRLDRADAEKLGCGVAVLWVPEDISGHETPTHLRTDRASATVGCVEVPSADDHGLWISRHFEGRAWVAVELHRGPDDAARLATLHKLGNRHALPLVATGDVHMHIRERRALQDVMTAIHLGTTIAEAGHALFPNGERHLRDMDDLQQLYAPALLAETLRIAALCTFDMNVLRYEYPHELVPAGKDPTGYLRQLTFDGAAERFPHGISEKLHQTLEKELALIKRKEFEAFFLTVHDIVRWAKRRKILCQGRGSSANSAVCFCLGITSVNPEEGHLLFERFLSDERNEPPDIDVDFEHERREEVIQYVFGKYGRERTAIAATVISYRSKSAVRDVGKALGLPLDQLDSLAAMFSRIRSGSSRETCLRERGFDPDNPTLLKLFALAGQLMGFPRHLSQHVGGFVISEHPLHTLVPIENAAMPDRTIIQWDKDDLETMKLLKVDCLALGMLTCLRKCFDLLQAHKNITFDLAGIPQNDEPTYEMIRAADTIGVFQIESRAQMSMLPRLKPAKFYDLVIEVAIVRPGPIQGGMVHPYLKNRKNPESVVYESANIEEVLGRTLGVPIFQEQVMELLRVAADFTPGEADSLRRSMAAWRRRGGLEHFEQRIFEGMKKNNYSDEFAQRIFRQIQGFGEYGFPESHSYSFALLAYVSSWLKRHHPEAFTCALLNAQPMGFYQPSQLIQDAQRHGVRVLSADVVSSVWDCTLEYMYDTEKLALRLGLRQIRGISEDLAIRLAAARAETPFEDVADMTRRARVSAPERTRLADAGALQTLSGHRYRARWDSAGAELPTPVLAHAPIRERRVGLRQPSLREDVMTDYATLGLSLEHHPLSLIRAELERRRASPASITMDAANRGRRLRCAGLVTVRQHPGTAKGVTFVTLEDETGHVNVVIWRALAEKQHRVLLESTVMAVDGVLEASDGVHHLIADRLHDYSALLPEFAFASRNFH